VHVRGHLEERSRERRSDAPWGGKKLARVLVVVPLVLGLMVVFKVDIASLTLVQEAGMGVCLRAAAALVGGQ
jgi:hypothetical protein